MLFAASAQTCLGPQQAAPQVIAPNGQANMHFPPRQVRPSQHSSLAVHDCRSPKQQTPD
jgi:hypothetical protein